MTLTELRYITAVAQHLHFGRAAEVCFVSQPTLSVAVKKLEDELGVALFERRHNEVAVTPVGLRIIEQAARVLEEAERVRQIARQGRDELAAPLRLAAIFTIGPYLLPALIPALARIAPDMTLVIREDYTRQLAEALKRGEVDAVILALPFEEPGLEVEPLYDEPFLVAMPKTHAWARRRRIPAAQLAQENVLLLRAGNCFREHVLAACPDCRRAPQDFEASIERTLEGSSLETIRHMTAAGAGISVLPCTAWTPSGDVRGMLVARPFERPEPTRRVALAYRRSFPRPRAIAAVREAIAAADIPCVVKVSRGASPAVQASG